MKKYSSLLCGVILCGMMLCSSEAYAQNQGADWLRLGAGILDAVNRSSNQNNYSPNNGNRIEYRWNNAPMLPAPGETGRRNSGQFNNNPFPGATGSSNLGRLQSGPFIPRSSGNLQSGIRYNSSSGYSQSRSYPQQQYRYPSNSYDSPPVAPKVYSKKPIVINCPAWCEGVCTYSIIGASGKEYVYSISPGQKQEFRETTDWKIKYNRGGGRGYKTYKLHGGKEYELHSDGGGRWAFYASP